jgi:hypothetical protein
MKSMHIRTHIKCAACPDQNTIKLCKKCSKTLVCACGVSSCFRSCFLDIIECKACGDVACNECTDIEYCELCGCYYCADCKDEDECLFPRETPVDRERSPSL